MQNNKSNLTETVSSGSFSREKEKTTHYAESIIFIMCSFVPVGLEDYVDFFKNHFKRFIYISMTFPHKKGKIKVTMDEYATGSLVNTKQVTLLPSVNKPLYFFLLPINYMFYIFAAFYLLGRSIFIKEYRHPRIVYFGINYICTFIGLLLRFLKRVHYVIYRVMDFFPIPKSGQYRYLNRIFFVIDKFCLDKSDFTIFTTEGHIAGREKYGYFDRKKRSHHKVPLGVLSSKIVMKSVEETTKNTLVYCGVVSRYHMIDMLLNVVKRLKNKIPDIRLEVIGSGPDADYFQQFVKDEGLEKNVTFHGFMPEGKEFEEIMSRAVLGIALYRDEEDFMKYTEPAKVKHYLGYGTPVLMSDVPMIARELDEKEVAIAIKNDEKLIEQKIHDFLKSPSLQAQYKSNIKNYLNEVNIETLLEEALSVTFRSLDI